LGVIGFWDIVGRGWPWVARRFSAIAFNAVFNAIASVRSYATATTQFDVDRHVRFHFLLIA
jgi:hypothetical protein